MLILQQDNKQISTYSYLGMVATLQAKQLPSFLFKYVVPSSDAVFAADVFVFLFYSPF